ncbi:MAG: hypothetical protein GX575_13095 [Candidatus Anammoximicrobium sp.]|nr:hypothetical protein [Candidatus Anammoximicrobium sp.]
MNESSIVVCEKTGKWAAAIRRVLRPACGVCETRSWPACLRELQIRTTALAAVEVLPESAESVCRRLAEFHGRFRPWHVILLADRSLQGVEWLLREAGAAHVLFAPRDIVRLRPVWERFLAQIPPSHATFREHVRSQLPWARQASGDEWTQA